MSVTPQHILEHHKGLRGKLHLRHFKSRVLGIRKSYYVYQSADWDARRPFLLLWLFRGHEREWVNFREDSSRLESTAIEDLDALNLRKIVPPTLAIMPGLTSSNNWVPSGGVNMVGEWKPTMRGLGTGRFWDYLTGELMPHTETAYNPKGMATRAGFGFSLGGYTLQLLSMRVPGYFDHAAFYDGLFPWPSHQDPRLEGDDHTDKIWTQSPIFDAAFGKPRDTRALDRWNPTDTLVTADDAWLEQLRQTRFWINSAAGDGSTGNIDRAKFIIGELERRGIHNQMRKVPFDEHARHNWHWTDAFFNKVVTRISSEY